MRNRKKRAEIILKLLDESFPNPEIPLDHRDPFTLLVAVVLSAQSTDAQVNKVTPALFAKAATPEEMAALTIEEIQTFIASVGLAPTKARALKGLAERLVHSFQGKVPRRRADLESLPGVGRKTASVVLAQAFGRYAFPVDTHIHRLAQRWGLTRGKDEKETEKDLKKLFPKEVWHKLHLQMIYYGRSYCPARNHEINRCPICKACHALEEL